MKSTALWIAGPGRAELRTDDLPEPGPDDCVVRTLASGISAGTERLVLAGGVPAEVADTMRAPLQEGDFPFPVKYGYLNVGRVIAGPDALRGRRVFGLAPHQDLVVVPAAMLTPLPDAVPTERALLAGAVETGLNALWDVPPLIGDRVAVVGAGLIGLSTALLLDRLPLDRLVVLDPDAGRRALAASLGLHARDADERDDADLVFHCSATAEGLNAGLDLLGFEGTLIELSWYGDREPAAHLGGRFHARRLSIVGSQVGSVSPRRRSRRTHAERMATVVDLLRDERFDRLVGQGSAFADLPHTMARLAQGEDLGLCHVVRYPDPEES